MENVIVVSGGIWQSDLVDFLKSKNYRVHVINPVETETTKKADGWIKADVRSDPKALYKLVAKLDPLLVMTDQSDIANMPTAQLASNCSCEYNIPEVVKLFTDKSNMAIHAANHGIAMPLTYVIDRKEHLRSCLTTVLGSYPAGAFIKPADNHSSRGVTHVQDILTGDMAFDHAMTNSFSGRVVIQGAIEGTMITVEGFVTDGKHHTLATSVKQHFRSAIASRLEYPSRLFTPEIQADNDKYVELAGLQYGPTHAEYIIDKDGKHWLIEIAARGAGSSISSVIVPHVCGMDVYEQWHNDLIGEDVRLYYDRDSNMALLKFYEYAPGADVPSVDRLYEAKGLVPGLYEISLNQVAIDNRKPAYTGTDRHACAVILGDPSWSYDDLLNAESILDDFMACVVIPVKETAKV